MKKGIQIIRVDVDSEGRVTAMDSNWNTMKLTYQQRKVISGFNNPNYFSDVAKCFGNENILTADFQAYKCGELVLSR